MSAHDSSFRQNVIQPSLKSFAVYAACFAANIFAGACSTPGHVDDVGSELSEDSDATESRAALACSGPVKRMAGQRPCPLTVESRCVSAIEQRSLALQEAGPNTYPMTEVLRTPDASGHYQFLEIDAAPVGIYCAAQRSPARAVLVYGAILAEWASRGYELSSIGYPVTDERDASAAESSCAGATRVQEFGGGHLCWAPDRGTWSAVTQD
jgi:hypothetical protein